MTIRTLASMFKPHSIAIIGRSGQDDDKEIIVIPDPDGGTGHQPMAGLSCLRRFTGPMTAAVSILAAALMAGACAQPNVQLRKDMAESIGKFGLRSFYPR
ncbi:MAG: hypothetical protein U1F76_11155 [Candidatus Competibacteraceae bacterium]